MALNENTVGEVGVEVYGNLDRLRADLAKGKQETEKFDKEVSQGAGSMKQFTKATEDSGKALDANSKFMKYWNATAERRAKLSEMMGRSDRKAATVLKQRAAAEKEAGEAAEKATKKMQEAANQQQQMGKFTKYATDQVKSMGRQLLALFALERVANYMHQAVVGAMQLGKELTATSERLGMNTTELQKWNFIASQTGVTQSAMEQGFENLGKSMGKAAAGAERETKTFALLGISLKNLDGTAKSTAQVMPELADALMRIEDANQRAAVAQILLGESATDMLPALKGGSERINELSDAAEELGLVLSEQEIAKLKKAATTMEEVKNQLSVRIAGIVADNADSIITLTSALAGLAAMAAQAAGAYVSFWEAVGKYAGKGLGTIGAYGNHYLGLGFGGRKAGVGAGFDVLRGFGFDPSTITDMMNGEAPPAQSGGGAPIDASGILAPKPGRGRRAGGPSAETLRLRELRKQIEFANQLAGLRSEYLQAFSSSVTSADEKAKIDLELLDIEKERFAQNMKLEGPEGTKKYTAAQVSQMEVAFAKVDAEKRNLVEIEREQQLRKEKLSLSQGELAGQIEVLQSEQELAKTNKRRVELERELLTLQFQKQRQALENQVTDKTLSDTTRAIAKAQLEILDIVEQNAIELNQRNAMSEVQKFWDALERTHQQVIEVADRFEASRLQQRVDASAQMADDIGSAFGDLARNIRTASDPLDLLKNLLYDLTDIFTDEVLARPLQEWARNAIGAPIAERVTGFGAGPEGLFMDQLNSASIKTSISFEAVTASATTAAAALQSIAASSALGGGGAGGGLLGTILGVTKSFIPSSSLMASVDAAVAANPGIFHDGGRIGPDGHPVRRKLKPGEVNITAQVDETVISKGPSAMFRRELDMINAGIRPDFGGGMSSYSPSVSVAIGDIVLSGANDERGIRRAGRQAASEIGARVAHAAKTGIVKP